MATYKTKYDIEDTVYFLRENRIVMGSIKDIRIVHGVPSESPNICYNIRYKEPGNHRYIENSFNEVYLFLTMELLAESLIADFEKRENE